MSPTARPISRRSPTPPRTGRQARWSSACVATTTLTVADASSGSRCAAAPSTGRAGSPTRRMQRRTTWWPCCATSANASVSRKRARVAKSHFLATMSHELRTPLNAIIGFSDMLINRDREIEPARRIEYARLINESGRHLLSVVNDMLDMSKLETGNFEISPDSFAPADAITACCNLFMLKAQRAGIALEVRVPELPEIVADRRAFTQILINLIANAVKFTPAGGRVTVSAACEGARLAMSIEDNGVGIAEDDLPRLGEAFFQARASYDRRYDGTGLGLSIVKGLLSLHGGDMRIESRLGEGTRVVVRLPIDCRGAGAAEPAVAWTAPRAATAGQSALPRVRQRA